SAGAAAGAAGALLEPHAASAKTMTAAKTSARIFFIFVPPKILSSQPVFLWRTGVFDNDAKIMNEL
ncbi:MAG: hypothetical protein J5967_00725, partial [Oscillospiraceae bacterium]|nr:hypothetical protein [Oscillospiraceae bacterium]